MEHSGKRVEIRPWPLLERGRLAVLLDRRVAGLQDRGERLRAIGDHAARGTEIEEKRVAVRQDEDVVGRDVSMHGVRAMQDLQRVEQLREKLLQASLVRRRLRAAQFL